MIVIIDYGMGNLGSVLKAVQRVTKNVKISTSVEDLLEANKLILPGVGHFENGMKKLKEFNYIDELEKKVLNDKTPILGICLGMQLFATKSEEGNTLGLNWIPGEVKRFSFPTEAYLKWKVPQMGWNSTIQKRESPLFLDLEQNSLFYFVHSYYFTCENEKHILGTTKYYTEFTSVIQKGNIYGTQFHPEKSHDTGFQMIKNFIKHA